MSELSNMAREARPKLVALTRESLPPAIWSMTVPVRFGDCDIAGIVFTPRFFDLLHPVIERFFIDCLGINYYDFGSIGDVALGYGHASCDFFRPTRMGDELETGVIVERIGTNSYTLLLHGMNRGFEAVRGRFVTVTMEMRDYKSVPIPAVIVAALEAYRDRCAKV